MTGLGIAPDLMPLLRRARAILLDFDGPVCAVFAGPGARNVAAGVRQTLAAGGYAPNGDDSPHDVLAYAATVDPEAARVVEHALARAELDAVTTAEATPGASAFLAACTETARPVAIVSNNSPAAIAAYLDQHELAWSIAHVEGRDADEARHMKPNPWTLARALARLDVDAQDALLVGDAATDIEAARTLSVPSIGYANRPDKTAKLRDAGADAIVTDMLALADAVSAAGRPS